MNNQKIIIIAAIAACALAQQDDPNVYCSSEGEVQAFEDTYDQVKYETCVGGKWTCPNTWDKKFDIDSEQIYRCTNENTWKLDDFSNALESCTYQESRQRTLTEQDDPLVQFCWSDGFDYKVYCQANLGLTRSEDDGLYYRCANNSSNWERYSQSDFCDVVDQQRQTDGRYSFEQVCKEQDNGTLQWQCIEGLQYTYDDVVYTCSDRGLYEIDQELQSWDSCDAMNDGVWQRENDKGQKQYCNPTEMVWHCFEGMSYTTVDEDGNDVYYICAKPGVYVIDGNY